MIYENLDNYINESRKNNEADALRTFRLLKAELVKYEKDSGSITDAVEQKIVAKMIKQRNDSLAQYDAFLATTNDSDKVELAMLNRKEEQAELDLLKSLFPDLPSDDDVENFIRLTITNYKLSKEEGYKLSMKDMRPIMTTVQGKYPSADGKLISSILKEVL